MSSFKAVLAGLLALTLSACGFQPIAAPVIEGAGSDLRLRSLVVRVDDDRFAYTLRQELLEAIVIDPNAEFDLVLETTIRRSGLAVTDDDEITRYNLNATTVFALSELTDDETTRGRLQTTTSLNATASIISTEVLERESRNLLARDTARRMINWLRQRRMTDQRL